MLNWLKGLKPGVIAGGLFAGALLLAAPNAQAHANLMQSEPAADSSVAKAPTDVRLSFSERPEPKLSSIQVFNEQRQRVDDGSPAVEPNDALSLVERLQAGLPTGTYTVSWQTTSAVDGHVTDGSFAFGVGVASSAPNTLVGSTQPEQTLSWSAAGIRWLNYLAFALLFGVVMFEPAVLRRAFPPDTQATKRLSARVDAVIMRCRRLAQALAAAGIAAACAAIADQASRSGQLISGAAVETLAGTSLGRLLLARLLVALAMFGVLVVAGGFANRFPHRSLGAAAAAMRQGSAMAINRGWLLPALALAQLLLVAFTSHALAASFAPDVLLVVDWLHLALAGAWTGGLAALALAVVSGADSQHASQALEPKDFLYPLIRQFSRLALLAIAGLGLTGLAMAVVHVGSFGNLLATSYGRALVLKSAVFVAALALAAGHRFVLLPALSSRNPTAVAAGRVWFSRGLPAEAFLGIAILAATSLLASLPPSTDRAGSGGLMTKDVAGLHVSLQVQPLLAGPNGFRLSLMRNGQPVTDAAKVELQLQQSDLGTGAAVLDLTNAGQGVYTVQSDALSMSGLWRAELLIRTPGELDRRTEFDLTVKPAQVTSQGAAPTQVPHELSVTSALPEASDLTLGGAAADSLVGLTLRPGQPGKNQVLLYIMPRAGEKAGSSLPVSLEIQGQSIPLEQCAATCRLAMADLRGGEDVRVRVGDAPDAVAAFHIPDLPAASGDTLLHRVQARMRQLHSLRIQETLGPADPPVRADYTLQAPDRLAIRSSTGEEVVWFGKTRFLRPSQTQPWQDEATEPLKVPSFMWDALPAQSVFLGARETVDGVETDTISFFELSGRSPTWFRLWVESDGLVRRMEMWAPRHFMADRYYDFDAMITVQPPATAGSAGLPSTR